MLLRAAALLRKGDVIEIEIEIEIVASFVPQHYFAKVLQSVR